MKGVFSSICLIVLLVGVSCEEESSNGECGAYGSYFNFTIVDKATGHDLFFGDSSVYSEDDLELYVISQPKPLNPADSVIYLILNPLESDSGRVFLSFLPAFPNEEKITFARIGQSDIDTIRVTSRFEGYYSQEKCRRIVVDKVYYNGELVCSECVDSVSYVIRK